MQHLRRSIASTKLRTGGLISGVPRSGSVGDGALRSGCFKGVSGGNILAEDKLGAAGFLTARHSCDVNGIFHQYRSLYLLSRMNGSVARCYFSRSYAARSTKNGETASEGKKDISKVEDPFDAPTYNIPEKPVTFVEGASYSVVILVGLGVAAAAAYAVFNELIFQPKEYKIFNTALKRIQDDSQVRIRIGSPITGYGQESRNRAARQRIPHRFWTDEEGVDHIEVNFYIRGPHGAGKVYCQMFKDKVDKQWKFTSLIVQILSPSPAQLLLESYVPA
ncbi:hypothetical protein MLD38_023801 [Melastoma candidum]|uniref:Uncharacterized protein n=1 Tax=Melastoma candidum TaxID=119954 RepID=A0ACB9NQ83_9MYRT|nr:hypothetical protein MLD38_023801 [Melastoma candidum]